MKKFMPVFLFLLFAVSVSMFVSSCGKPADSEIMTAEDAIQAAVTAGAEDNSPKLLEKARSLLQEAKMLNEQGKYSEARKKAETATLRAEKAQKNSEHLGSTPKAPGAVPEEQTPPETGETENTEG